MGDIVRAHGDALWATTALAPQVQAVLRDLARCRTPALGGHVEVCDRCGLRVPHYNSCRNRHCPTCQALEAHRWMEQRRERILPIRCFHVVFTLPEALRTLVQHQRRALFTLLFQAASETLLILSADPKRLGALPAISMVLHTWTRELVFHPHLHAVVSAGGLSPDRSRWVPLKGKGDYLFPVKVLAKLFRWRFRERLIAALTDGTVTLPPDSPPDVLDQLRKALCRTDWHVYAKPPFGGPEHVFQYLSRYTHRVGISNSRLRAMDQRGVTFATKDGREVTLEPVDFLRRFVQHVLPAGFVRIRHYGLLAPCHATSTLELARSLLAPAAPAADPPPVVTANPQEPWTWIGCLLALTGIDAQRCPRCGVGRLVREDLPDPPARAPPDTS
jgi:hypothetical protein